jgi:hypothetical protein
MIMAKEGAENAENPPGGVVELASPLRPKNKVAVHPR